MALSEERIQIPAAHMGNVFGELDRNVKQIEAALSVSVFVRDGEVHVKGQTERASHAAAVLRELFAISQKGIAINEQNVTYSLQMSTPENTDSIVGMSDEIICHTVNGKPVQPKTLGQKAYVDAIRDKMIVFGNGPAGTGKTYLAIASAVEAFRNQEVSKIILTRPAIEAGEKLGFLPGDLQSKIDPYLRPLYDALFQIMGAESFAHHVEKGEIEVAPLAYMRGRTLDNAYIILDEAQNTTPSQMKMFLTRIGFQSKCVITGDRTQKDLPRDTESGLDIAMKILKGIDEISFVELSNKDVVRHPLVQKIVEAYEKYDSRMNREKERRHDGDYRKRNR